ncbi:MAG: hypothetical protein M1561_00895 [Gammaproteobacteria bacterium]|nr:hypothetical protein [Gammaproteobacteria bacterium]
MEKNITSSFSDLINTLLKKKYWLITLAINFISAPVFANQPNIPNNTLFLLTNIPPSLSAQIDMSNGNGSFQGNFFLPVLANFDHILYADLEGQYSANQDSSLLGLGAGYRQLVNQAQIFGGYLFLSRNLTPDKHELWVANPGLECLGKAWDFRVNGYFPIGVKSWSTQEGYAEDFGDYEFVAFREHQMLDRWIKDLEQAGSGGDAEVGYHVAKIKGLSFYAGPYYYRFNDSHDMYGGEARIKYDLNNHFSFLAVDSYDNQNKNIFTLALRITIGGNTSKDHDLAERLSDPVEHYIASREQGTATPIIKKHYISSALSTEENDIWFFESDNSNVRKRVKNDTEDGTYEHPYDSIDQATLDSIYAKQKTTKLYLKPGTYASDSTTQGQLTVKSGMSIYGRTSDFVRPANGNDRALLQGGMTLLGSNTLDSLRFTNNDGTQNVGITITGTGGNHIKDITLNNINVGATNANDGYATGILINYADNIFIKNSSVISFLQDSADYTRGIDVSNSILTLDNSDIIATNRAVNASITASSATGIYIYQSTLNVLNGSTITAAATASGAQTTMAYGIFGPTKNKIKIDNSSVSAIATTQNGATAKAYGIEVSKNSSVTLQGTKPAITANASVSGNNDATVQAYGISADNSTVNVNSTRATISATTHASGANTVTSYGIELLSSSVANITGGTIKADSDSYQAAAFAAYVDTGSTLNISKATLMANANEAAAGIFANSSTVNARFTTFNITSNGLHGFDGLGYGIYTVGSKLTQTKNTFNRKSAMGGDTVVF